MENMEIWKWIAQGMLSMVPFLVTLIWWLVKENANNVKKNGQKIDQLIDLCKELHNLMQIHHKQAEDIVESYKKHEEVLQKIEITLERFNDIKDDLEVLNKLIDHATEMSYITRQRSS